MTLLEKYIKEYGKSWKEIRKNERQAQTLDRIESILSQYPKASKEELIKLITNYYPDLFYDLGPHKLSQIIDDLS